MAGIQDTPLKVVRNYLIHITLYSIFGRVLFTCSALIASFLSIVHIWYFFYEFNTDVLVQYSQFACLTFFTFCQHYPLIIHCSMFKQVIEYQEETYIAIKSASIPTRRKIMQESRLFMAWFWIFLFYISCLSFILVFNGIGEQCKAVFVPCYLLKKYVQNSLLETTLHILLLNYEVISSLVTMFSVTIYYFIINLRFELYFLQEKLKEIYVIKDDKKKIRDALIFIITHHAKVKKSHRLFGAIFTVFTFTTGVMGIITNFVYLSSIILRHNEIPLSFYFFLALICQHGSLYFFHLCQQIENESEKLFKICCEAPWYDWDQNTKRLYQIFLLNVSQDMKLFFTYEISCNYQVLIRIFKVLFTGVNVLLTLTQKE